MQLLIAFPSMTQLLIAAILAVAGFRCSDSLRAPSRPASSTFDATKAEPACAADLHWGVYPDDPVMNSTKVVKVLHMSERLPTLPKRPQPWQDLFVYPPKKFAFCSIAKNGCSTWSYLFEKILQNNISAGFDSWKANHDWIKSYPNGLQEVFADPDATRAVFVRDPLERFVSAFLDKCHGSDIKNCPAATMNSDPTFQEVVEWYLRTPNMDNQHWKQQSHMCDLRERIDQYNVIGLMTKTSYAEDAACLMERAGISEFNRVSEDSDEPFWQKPTINVQTGSEEEEEIVMQKLFTKDVAKRLIERLKHDYDLFKFDRNPKWLANATGELYTVTQDKYASLWVSPGLNFVGQTPLHEETEPKRKLSHEETMAKLWGQDDIVTLWNKLVR